MTRTRKPEKVGDRQIKSIEAAMKKLGSDQLILPAKQVLYNELFRLKHGYDRDKLEDKDVTDIAISAFEGGINYWCDKIECVGEWPKNAEYASDALVKGATLKLHDYQDDKFLKLTADKLRQGIILRSAMRGQSVQAWLDDHDASEADCAVQMGLFNEIVYG